MGYEMSHRSTKYLISGWYGFGNLGDEAILHAIHQALRQTEPGCEVRVLSFRPEHTLRYHGIDAKFQFPCGLKGWAVALLRGRILAPFCAVLRCDVLLLGGGGFLSDWQPEAPWHWLRQAILARLLGRKVQLYGIGAGPFRRAWGKWMTRTFIKLGVDRITVRDEASKVWLETAGVPVQRIQVLADPVFGLQGENRGRPIANGGGAVIGFSLAPVFHLEALWPGQRHRYQAYLVAMAEACKLLASRGHRLVFLPMHEEVDRQVADNLESLAPGLLEYRLLPGGVETAIKALGEVDVLVAMRLHAGILAAIQGVIPVGVIYHSKVDAFLERIGMRHLTEELGDGSNWRESSIDPVRLVRSVETALREGENLRETMAMRLGPLRSAALANAAVAVALGGSR